MQVYLVDDDADLRESLSLTLEHAGYSSQAFRTGYGFLSVAADLTPGCVLLDFHLPDLDGLQVQRRLFETRTAHVVILLTGAGGVPQAVAAMRGGAVDFLQKPYDRTQLLEALRRAEQALARSGEERSRIALVAKLSAREREVLGWIAKGRLTKEIAFEMGLSPRTIELHRTRVLRKLNVPTIGAALLLAQAGGAVLSPDG